MAAQGVAKRYAEAVFEIANEDGSHDRWLADLDTLARAASDPESREFFENPAVPEEEKYKTVAQLLPDTEQTMARNLATILIERQRFEILPDLLETYRELVLEARGIAIAEVTTAVELNDSEQQRVRNGLERLVGREIELRPHVDPSIIGGMVARIGDQLIDGSVVSQLQRMRERLVR